MNQESPILRYRIKCDSNETDELLNKRYDFKSGLWIDELGEPLIKKYVESIGLSRSCETLITETREGVDRSESSRDVENNVSFSDETLITATREGIDRSEKAYECYSNLKENEMSTFGETLLTRTREGVDRSERSSNDDDLAFQTITTFTRESIDRSEKS